VRLREPGIHALDELRRPPIELLVVIHDAVGQEVELGLEALVRDVKFMAQVGRDFFEPLLEMRGPIVEFPLETFEPLFKMRGPRVEPLLETVEPLLETLEPLLETLEPLLETLEPLLDTLEPLLDTVESLLDTVELPLQPRRGLVKFVLDPLRDLEEELLDVFFTHDGTNRTSDMPRRCQVSTWRKRYMAAIAKRMFALQAERIAGRFPTSPNLVKMTKIIQ
jgi:hypothetical protein